jgi:hypothetical protein
VKGSAHRLACAADPGAGHNAAGTPRAGVLRPRSGPKVVVPPRAALSTPSQHQQPETCVLTAPSCRARARILHTVVCLSCTRARSETYEYYKLPYCKPSTGVRYKTLGMGEVGVAVWRLLWQLHGRLCAAGKSAAWGPLASAGAAGMAASDAARPACQHGV